MFRCALFKIRLNPRGMIGTIKIYFDIPLWKTVDSSTGNGSYRPIRHAGTEASNYTETHSRRKFTSLFTSRVHGAPATTLFPAREKISQVYLRFSLRAHLNMTNEYIVPHKPSTLTLINTSSDKRETEEEMCKSILFDNTPSATSAVQIRANLSPRLKSHSESTIEATKRHFRRGRGEIFSIRQFERGAVYKQVPGGESVHRSCSLGISSALLKRDVRKDMALPRARR